MIKIFIVIGFSGQHDDYTSWDVAAYTKENLAKEHADRAQCWANSDLDRYKQIHGTPAYSWNPKFSPWDPNIIADYIGVYYTTRKLNQYKSINEFVLLMATNKIDQ